MSTPAKSEGTICILPQMKGLGGPVSFQARLMAGLRKRGYTVHHDPFEKDCSAILVIGGISRMDILWRAHQGGVRIVQRLNGMNWMHRKIATGRRHYLRAEWNNFVLTTIRRQLADHVVYQSQFARTWWHTVHGQDRTSSSVIFNGVDLQIFNPEGPHQRPNDVYRVLLVEGHLGGGYEQGLKTAIQFAQLLNKSAPKPVELMVVGEVSPSVRKHWNSDFGLKIDWAGVVPREQIPQIDRSAHLLFSVDLNAACPNSVIEALACGLPVISFATGSLPELIEGDSGKVVPYGSNYWNVEPPDINALIGAACEMLSDPQRFRRAARARAEAAFGLDKMVDDYLKALFE
jgi:glycosyltransferase involved in cell wall biosynthesis